MNRYISSLILVCCLVFACNPISEEVQNSTPGSALLQKMVDAMGGMERYRKLHDVTYELTYRDMVSGKQDSSTEKYLYAGELSWATYHQHTKNVAPDKEGPVLQAWNGRNAWLIVEGNFVPAPPALRMVEFGRKTSFFWMNMMFKMLDPGTIHERLPNRSFDGKVYEIVQITYDENIGDAQDRFILYINPSSKLVEHFLFSNAFMGPEVPPRMMHVEFQEVEGIKFPKRQWYETADWEGNIVAGGPPKSEKLYTNIKINTGIEPSLFDRPILTDILMADIRNAYLKNDITKADTEKGHQLIALLETACGGFDHWRSFSSATFTQTADWYDNETNWTTNPQEFSMTCILGSSDGELQLLNGPRAKTAWKIADGHSIIKAGDGQAGDPKMVMHKQTYKSYWFQLPFRLREADFITYGGTRNIEGTNYDVVYATWHSMEPNSKYDQYMLYLHPETYRLEWLEFTIRDIFPMATGISQFTNYQEVDGLTLPMSQFITQGTLDAPRKKLHENHYQTVSFN